MGTQLPSPKKGNNPKFSVQVCCGQTAGWIKMPLDTELDLGPGDIVLDGKPARPQGGGTAPAILAHVLWPNGAWIKVPFDTGVGLGQGHIVLHEDPAPLKKGHITPSFVCCGQTAGWVKMPLDREVDVGSGDIVLHGDPAPPKGAQPPIFGPCLLWPNGRPSQLLLSSCYTTEKLT